jgi:RNA ligase
MVMDKLDGSLGVLYPLPDGGHAVATRGSFVSEQALWATEHWREQYAHRFTPNPAWTYLFEVIIPWNRVVLDYGNFEGLVLLGAVETVTGRSVPLERAGEFWPGKMAEVLPYPTFGAALAAPPRPNAEGFVIWAPHRDERVKLKQDDYKRLHKLLTGVNGRHIWEVLAAGQDPVTAFAGAPDEFHEWVRAVIADLQGQYAAVEAAARADHARILAALPEGWGRREFAQAATATANSALQFLLLDGRPLDAVIWKQLRPAATDTFRLVTSDAD